MSVSNRSDAALVRIAVIGLVGILTLILLALNVQRLPLVGGGTTYRAEFADAAGLVAGEEVRVAGLKVGNVTDIELGRGTVIVSFRVKGVDLGERTTAGIEVKTLLGQHYLSLTPAGPGELDPDETIPLARTTTPVNIVPAFQRLASQSAEIDTAQVAEAFDSLSEVLDRTAPEMGSTLRGLARLSRSVASRDEDIRALFARANEVSGVVAARDRELTELLRGTVAVLDVLDRRRETITQIIDGTGTLARQLTGLVRDNDKDLGPALAKLNGVLDVLQANKQQIDEILRTALTYGREFANMGGTGRWFDAAVKFPRGMALCDTGTTNNPLSSVISAVLSQINSGVNGSDRPCLPLGPASGGTK